MHKHKITLGCIADDLTGATDLANSLVRAGMRTIQTIGVPDSSIPEADAVIIALKSRTLPVAEAVQQSKKALAWLQQAQPRQVLFKYCSTFDSTDAGNIGPVADALMAELSTDFTIACPAFPTNGRTIYQGHLFVGDQLLSESSMRLHPLTPMTDANLVRVLSRQTPNQVGLVSLPVVLGGKEKILNRFAELQKQGFSYGILDAVDDENLFTLGEAIAELPLLTGGSGITIGLPQAYRKRGWLTADTSLSTTLPDVNGYAAVIAGSCSTATLGQIEVMKASNPAHFIDPLSGQKEELITEALNWAQGHLGERPILIYASSDSEGVNRTQQALGKDLAGELIEEILSTIALKLKELGVRKLIVAGGETSGAVMSKLGVSALQIGPQIDPGVPWTATLDEPKLLLALKSGNFGTSDFFLKAFRQLP
jgi:uncharacterized protein YgbK (DUF1537 family)